MNVVYLLRTKFRNDLGGTHPTEDGDRGSSIHNISLCITPRQRKFGRSKSLTFVPSGVIRASFVSHRAERVITSTMTSSNILTAVNSRLKPVLNDAFGRNASVVAYEVVDTNAIVKESPGKEYFNQHFYFFSLMHCTVKINRKNNFIVEEGV